MILKSDAYFRVTLCNKSVRRYKLDPRTVVVSVALLLLILTLIGNIHYSLQQEKAIIRDSSVAFVRWNNRNSWVWNVTRSPAERKMLVIWNCYVGVNRGKKEGRRGSCQFSRSSAKNKPIAGEIKDSHIFHEKRLTSVSKNFEYFKTDWDFSYRTK